MSFSLHPFFPAPPGSSSIHELTGSLPTYPSRPIGSFPIFSACRLHRQLVQEMKARSGLHRVSGEHAVAVQEVGGGHRLLARELEEQQADGGSSGGDDE